ANVTVKGAITTTADATIRSSVDTTTSVVSDSSGLKGIAGAVAASVITSTAKAEVTDDADLTIGGDLFVQSDTVTHNRTMARSSSGEDGSVGVAIAVSVQNTTNNAYLDGTAHVSGNVTVNASQSRDDVPVTKLF